MAEVTYPSENQLIDAYLTETISDKGILLFHDIFGYRLPENRKFADLLNAAGYVVLLPDLYRGNPWPLDTADGVYPNLRKGREITLSGVGAGFWATSFLVPVDFRGRLRGPGTSSRRCYPGHPDSRPAQSA